MNELITRENAIGRLAMAGYGPEAPALLDRADRYPGMWEYTADRHRAVVKHMPAGRYEVRDTEESEERIKAIAARRRGRGTRLAEEERQ